MRKILILYATREGQTGKVATQIGKHLETLGAGVQLVNTKDKEAMIDIDLDAFDSLVFGASMHAGGLEKELLNCTNENKKTIERKARSFFSSFLVLPPKIVIAVDNESSR